MPCLVPVVTLSSVLLVIAFNLAYGAGEYDIIFVSCDNNISSNFDSKGDSYLLYKL